MAFGTCIITFWIGNVLCLIPVKLVEGRHSISKEENGCSSDVRHHFYYNGNYLHHTTVCMVAIYPPDCCLHSKVAKYDFTVYLHSGLYIDTAR